MRGDPDNLSAMVLRVQKWLVTKRWRKAIYGAICVQKCEDYYNYACVRVGVQKHDQRLKL